MAENKSGEERPRREYRIPIGGIILLFLGIVFLLQTLGVLPWGLWGTLWRYWPVILILIGIRILLRNYSSWLVNLLILVILFACLGLAIWQHGLPPPATGQLTQSYSQPAGDLKSASINMDLPVGNISLSALAPDSANLVEAGFSQNRRDATMRTDFSQSGNSGTLNIKLERTGSTWSSSDFNWQANFSRNIPLTMDIKSAVSNLDADLSGLNINSLKMKMDVGNYKLTLPSSVSGGKVDIDTALSNTDITVPAGVAARITVRSDLSSVDINQGRFPRKGDVYSSADYDTAKNRLDITIHGDLGRLQVR